MPRLPVILVGIATSLIPPILCLAQVESGRIVGTVTDPNKAIIPGATVAVTNQATHETTRVTTNGDGDYTVTPLNPGVYGVNISAPGFQTAQIEKLEVQVNQSVRADVQLQIGSTATTVEVTAAAPLLNTEQGSLGTVVTNKEIVNLPLNGRSFYDLAKLTPGAATLPGGGNLLRIRANYISGTAISGVRGSQTAFLLDGVDVTDHHQGGTLIQTSIDGLQEFSVMQNAYSGEFGSAGGILNMSTKSGTDQFHGGLFEFLRNDKLDARNFFSPKRDVLKRNQFGGDLGGPLPLPGFLGGKGKTFFFVDYEGMRQRAGLVLTSIVPTAAMKQGNFSASGLNTIYDPLSTANGTRTAFAGNIIPSNRFSPQALFFNQFVPDPNIGARTFSWAPSQPLDTDQFTIRGDHTFGQKHRLFIRWSWDDYRESDPNAYPALGYADLRTRAQNVVAGLTSSFTPNIVNEAIFSWMPQWIDLQAFGQGTNFNQQAGITGFEGLERPGVAGSFPDFNWSGYTTPLSNGTTSSGLVGSAFDQRPKTQDFTVVQGIDNVTWIKGPHVLKFGTEIRYWQPLFTDSSNYQGLWSFTGAMTQNPAKTAGSGDAFADWMLGFPFSSSRAYPANWFGGYANYFHFFAQDDFKVSNRLTLNVGLRYEYSPWMQGYRNQLGTFNGTLAQPIIVASNTNQVDLSSQYAAPTAYNLFGKYIQTSHQAGLPLSITYPDNNQWAPRFGFAWRPFGEKTVLRGGYGMFYEMENTDGRVNRNILPYLFSETVFATANTVPNRTLANFFLGQPLGSSVSNPNMNPTYTHLNRGRDQHWNFGIQQQLAQDSVLQIDYVGNHGTHLNSTNPFNDPAPAAGAIQARRPYPIWGVMSYFSQDMSSDYDALQVKLEKRFGSGLWYLLSYTYSKSLVIQDTPAAGGDFYFEKARASYDIPQNLALNVGYELPFGKGKPFLSNAGRFTQALLGGWQAQGILILRSGQPFTATISRDVANTGISGQRP
ncbi:MAG: carboxypeptidase regulatory-like domain-containing protein, partial [Acidobacteriaceae bacterium]|nr:carboxypeptidase regulatory-like domain-containing protein [Acidobacteriaceae bacterium]